MEPMNNFTPRAQQVLALARKEADRFHHNYVGTEHLLLGLINLGQGVAVNVLQKMGLDLEIVRNAVEKQVGKGPESKPTGNIAYTPRVKKVLALSGKEAKALNHSYVGTEHILLGLLREGDGVAARVLKALEVDIERCREEILSELDPNFSGDMGGPAGPAAAASGGGAAFAGGQPEERRELKTPALKAFGRDLTELARSGELDPVIGRKDEIRRVVQILCRRTKNNPVLIGEAGVGKTAIVEGLALEIANGIVPEILADKRLITLDLALMVAGTKYRGQFEERIKAVMDEIRRAKNIIIFIDELHTIVGAGAAEGAMDASNIFKPALSRGELQCIGATTLAEYRKYIEKDSALDRRFQSVMVDAPSVEESIEILKGIAPKYEEHHKVNYTEAALTAAVHLSERYITARFLPDKAIDVLDESGARARINSLSRPKEIEDVAQEIEEICLRKDQAISKQQFEDAAQLRDDEKRLRAKREQMIESWKQNRAEVRLAVDAEDMIHVVSDWTGIPLRRMEQKESEKLLNLEKELQSSVIGQDEATIAIAKALRRSRADLKDPRRPIGSFLFMGPTGVGKTHLAKTLAESIFGDKDSMVQIDMSEYMEKFSVSRLIGSPPGYVGYEEGGQLTEPVRRRPYAVILLDEVEKAHPDVFNALLQVLDDGRLTDGQGHTVDFRNTVVIMTSNLGSEVILDPAATSEAISAQVMAAVRTHFRPEFLNRLDEVLIFNRLDRAQLRAIVDVQLAHVAARFAQRDLSLEVREAAKDWVAERGYDPVYGARPLKRVLRKELEDRAALALLDGRFEEGDTIVVDVEDDGLVLTHPQRA